jgi:3-hydroxyacyl-CoA dehydrogenase
MCLGGGVEISLHGAARHPHAELYMGLVEAGVGLIPGGGGCKEMLLRSLEAAPAGARADDVAVFEALKKNFETIAMAKVSTSAADAWTLGFLRSGDEVTMNRARLLMDENVLATLKLGVWMMREGEFISDHDAKVANWVAYALCGGKVTPGTLVSEQYLLDLEREAFLSLCGEKKTQERIAFTLKTGKPLRN